MWLEPLPPQRERNGLRSRNPCLQIYFRCGVSEIVQNKTVPSLFDGDSLQPGEIPSRIEAGYIAGDLDPADSIRFDIAKPSREEPHQLLVLWANTLRLAVVRITRSSMACKEFVDRADFYP